MFLVLFIKKKSILTMNEHSKGNKLIIKDCTVIFKIYTLFIMNFLTIST